MNLPMVVGEKIFIRGETVENRVIRFGLTNKDPKQIILPYERDNILSEVINPCPCLANIFNSNISLNENGSLQCFTDCRSSVLSIFPLWLPHHHSKIVYFANLSTNVPIWLVFVLPKEGGCIQISKQENTPSLMNFIHFWNHGWF